MMSDNTAQKELLIDLIQQAVDGCARYWASLIAEHLLKNGLRLSPPAKKPVRIVIRDAAGIQNGSTLWCQGSTVYQCPTCEAYIAPNQHFCHICGQKLEQSDK